MPDPAAMKAAGYCVQPDRDCPKMRCGYPLPCPFHTAAIVELGDDMTTLTLLTPAARAAGPRLRQIAKALGAKVKPRRRRRR